MNKLKKYIWNFFRTVILIGTEFIIMYPIMYMISCAFRDSADMNDPSVMWLPKHLTLDVMRDTIKAMEFGNALKNTLFLNVGCAVVQVISCAVTMMLLLKQRIEGKDTMLFINPGFPAQRNQAKLLGLKEEAFDIYSYRGKKLEEKLESILSNGNITAMIYSNPNNPAWTNLTEEELEIIGRMATKYDVIVLEDLAYFGMDFRKDIGHPGVPPFGSTCARYTDNYILLLSASKIFSYAGQRIALVCMSEKVADRHYEALEKFYEMPSFGDAYVFGVLYCASSGTAHSAQYALAAMLEKAVKGELPFVDHCREYAKKAERAKKSFTDNGFHLVYEFDGDEPISDGFFFTMGYPGMSAKELQLELLRYGVASISLPSTGSEQPGVRVCVSMLRSEDDFVKLERFLKKFNEDHKK